MTEIKMGKSMNTEPRGAVMYVPSDKNRGSSRTMAWIKATKVKAMNFWKI